VAQALPVAVARVMVVDDSVVVRRVVTRAFAHEPAVDVIGTARDGRDALAKLEVLRPDVVILDLDMPVMDGFETLAEIRRTHAEIPVIIFSHLTSSSAAATLDALALGAAEFALKPTADGIGLAEEHVRAALLPLIEALTVPAPRSLALAPSPGRRPARAKPGVGRVAAVVVAVSTGGPNALAAIVGELPADLSVPVLIVQHMPPVFTGLLAERLDRQSAISVVEASAGDAVVPGRVYLAPGGHHMGLSGGGGQVSVVLHDGPPENFCRPAADVLFRAAVDAYGADVLAVVLTGMGRDGLRGAEAVRRAGGAVIAQSEATCAVASMPAAVASAGLADAIVPLDGLSAALVQRVARGR
jgi:two-component system chemotaxis response regulator CheB